MRRTAAIIGGAILILLGVVLLAGQYLNLSVDVAGWLSIGGLLLMGVALLAYYTDSRVVGVLIPGCLLVGLGIGILLAALVPSLAVLFILGGLGLAFFAIQLVDRKVAGRTQVWAAFPGAVLLALGVILFVAEAAPASYESLVVIGGIGLALVLAGIASRTYGPLIPGGLMLGIGLGVFVQENAALADLAAGGVILGGIGVGFALIYVVGRLALRAGGAWPMVPAAFLVVFGAILYFAGQAGVGGQAETVVGIAWGGLLIALGIWIVLRLLLRRR